MRKTIGNRSEPFTVGGEPGGNFAATSSFAELTIIKEVQAVPIDKEVPLTSACLIACGVVTGMGSVFNRANVQPGDNTAVFGAGGVGLSVIQALRIKAAATSSPSTPSPSKGELALQARRHPLHQRQRRATRSRRSASCSRGRPRWPKARSAAAASTGRSSASATPRSPIGRACLDWGGICVQVGVPAPGVTYAVPITHLTQVDRGIIGSRAGGVRAQKDIPVIVDMYKKGLLDLDSMVSKTYPMENFFDVVEDMHEGTLARGVLTF